jgi:TP901 family phage tail tape measure protein
MFQRIGLGGTLTFNSAAADSAMKRSAGLFRNLQKSAKGAASGVRSIGMAVGGASLALLPLTAAMAVGAGQAASFENQMKAVQAITGASGEDLTRLTNKAKLMGATTAFSASQAGQGMEFLARAGANTDEIISALDGTMAAAAADGMSLADATNFVAQVVKGMGLSFGEATRVADVLALTSARSNTNISQLGSGFQYAAAQSRTMGFSLETTAAALGKIADSGLQGSIGGTSFTNMLVKLAKPSKAAGKFMQNFGIALSTTSGEMVPLPRIVEQFSKALGTIKDPVKQARMMTELFGVRGQKAFAALRNAGPPAIAALIKELEEAKGAADRMAKTRLDSFIGQMTILKSAAEGLAIELFGPILGAVRKFITAGATGIGEVAQAIQLLRSGLLDSSTKAGKEARAQFAKLGTTAKSIAKGVSAGIDWIVGAVERLGDRFSSIRKRVKAFLGPDGIERISRLATIFFVVAGAAAPVVGALAAIGLVISTVVVPLVSGLWAVLSAVASVLVGPVGAALLIVTGLVAYFKRENESLTQAFVRLGGVAIAWLKQIWTTGLWPLIQGIAQGFAPVFDDLKASFFNVVESFLFGFTEIGRLMGLTAMSGKTDWLEVGRTIGSALAAVISAVATLAAWVIRVGIFAVTTALRIYKAVYANMVNPFLRVIAIVQKTRDGLADLFNGNILSGLKKIGSALLDSLLAPLRSIVLAAITLADAVNIPIPDALRKFAESGFEPIRIEPKDEPGAAGARAVQTNTNTAAEAAAPPELSADVVVEDKRTINVKSALTVDGREIAFAVAENQTEVTDRAGFKATPWQRRLALEHGAVVR